MTFKPPPSRPGMRADLTRWNRAGLPRFDYVDGDAAVWLEELRIALLGLYMRGAGGDRRVPEYWRDVFMRDKSDWPAPADLKDARTRAVWQRLFSPVPDEPESNGKRTTRLLAQYTLPPEEYGWEIARAFARAAHVLLGHLNAFANEGYLRTATQWDNVRRLAAMVNYQPRPAASAVATVALLVDPSKGMAPVERGIAMKYAPPKGTPLIYETLEPLVAHPQLNAARAQDWNVNATTLNFSAATVWLAASGEGLTPGAPCALVADIAQAHPKHIAAAQIKSAAWDEKAGTARLTLAHAPGAGWIVHDTTLLVAPDGVLVGLPANTPSSLVLETKDAASFGPHTLVQLSSSTGTSLIVSVLEGQDGYLRLATAQRPPGTLRVERLTAFAQSSGKVATPVDVSVVYFRVDGGDAVVASTSFTLENANTPSPYRSFTAAAGASGPGFASLSDDVSVPAVATADLPEVVPGNTLLAGRAKFAGKPPKTLAAGDWFVARHRTDGLYRALRVEGIRKEEGFFLVQFHHAIGAAAQDTEFHGKLKRSLRPLDYDVSQAKVMAGASAVLQDLSDESRNILKPGRAVIVARETAGAAQAVQGMVVSFETLAGGLTKITLDTDGDLSAWLAGETKFHLNAVGISHGETRPPKTLGSGDGAQLRQSFAFKVTDVSFAPNSAAEAGVAPDMDVTVNGVKWAYRDYIDPAADGTEAYSTTLNDDGTLRIWFRRRLQNGSSNVVVSRHRVGTGAEGNAAPAYSFDKPMKKHANVTGIVQPFALTGGAAREPVSGMRVNAPSRLAANGRAVSLDDFARLARGNASVWRARAARGAPPASNLVTVTIVPAGGGAITSKLKTDLSEFLGAKMLPGTAVDIAPYQPMTIRFDATVEVDVARYEKNDVRRNAVAALAAAFTLQQRDLGEAMFVAQALATLQRVEGVKHVVMTGFSITNGAVPERTARTGGAVAAFFPTPDQVAYVASAEDIKLTMEAA